MKSKRITAILSAAAMLSTLLVPLQVSHAEETTLTVGTEDTTEVKPTADIYDSNDYVNIDKFGAAVENGTTFSADESVWLDRSGAFNERGHEVSIYSAPTKTSAPSETTAPSTEKMIVSAEKSNGNTVVKLANITDGILIGAKYNNGVL